MTEDWAVVEQEARGQMLTDLERVEAAVSPWGSPVAWVECRFGRTDGLSVVHRTGEPMNGVAMTLCGEVVPQAIRLLPLTPNLVRTLGRCRYCEASYGKPGVHAA